MQVPDSGGLRLRWTVAGPFLKSLSLALAALVLAMASMGTPLPFQAPRRLSQGQVSGQFLRAVLRADYATAYGRLAPEVRQAVSRGRFEEAARPLWKSGQRRGQEIELYKLGVRLGDRGGARLFYAFSFAADSSLKTPPVLLEVTFRDTASRSVLGFGMRTTPVPATKKPSGGASRKK